MVPRLTTALTGPLFELERRFLESETAIERWLRGQWLEHTPPFYASVDLRNAGFKLAPVDTNLFPGGFNNLNPAFLPLCVQAAQTAIEKICPEAKNLLLVPENHTRNQFYLMNVARLADPCAVLLNNDLSAGVPAMLQGLHEQFVIPPLHAGWHVRRKSRHFTAYREVVGTFARELGLDPWLIDPEFEVCGQINFHERTGEECLAAQVDTLLFRIRAKYREYGIDSRPFVIVKADAGTYGMGIMTVHDASEVKGLNRRQRNKMAVGKEGLTVTEVMIQEGVPTCETVDAGPAEPVVYMIDRHVVGGFYRVNTERGINENLNAPGMRFEPLAFDTGCSLPDAHQAPDAPPNRFYAYGVVARLALLAAAIEIERSEPAP